MSQQTRPHAQQIAALHALQSGLTKTLVTVAVVAMTFTATNVTLFAIDHHINPWIAWLLDPMVAVALGTVLIVDGRLSEYGVHPSGWASGLRWFAGLGTWIMNCWSSLWPNGAPFGIPRDVDPAGLVLHSIPPVLLIVLAEAITFYRRAILGKIAELRALVDTEASEVDAAPVHPASTAPSTTAPEPSQAERPALPVRQPSLVICGDQAVYALTVPPASASGDEEEPEAEKLPADEALNVIRACWAMGETIAEAARKSTRSTSYVHKVYQRLKDSADTSTQEPSKALVPVGSGAAR
ncbi:hypothetical protein QT196_11715 [Streptomyces sp. P9-2B-2]|uniref:hypothetical protein n=1 Tax=Streptomyces sp. P9-2B-2 TaxID=3057114 RepID=UPI0025B4C2A0|nr:hypothetical protein [Streptomyces sp. P9-2B-2]WJY37900.1 hypothetical protein QT196_11715 [Streptomyces sp. P9-2B-2]